MAQKYEVKYRDVTNVWHELQIYDDSYASTVIEINGSMFLDSPKVEDNLESIRGLGLRVELEADEDLTFSDLYSEDEQSFRVVYLRDSVQLFEGWLNPEGWYEDFVRDKWIVSFDCIDGLSYLENLSFINTDGTFITGRITQLEALRLAFLRTGLEKNIYTSIGIFYTGLATNVNVLANVYIVADRFYRDDGETIMSCLEVIKSIIEPYGAILKSYGAAWWLYKPNELWSTENLNFFAYEYDGTVLSGFGLDLSDEIGSHINNFTVFHCNENQSFSIKPSIGAHRIHYKYGLVASFFENTKLISDDGTTIDDWTIVSTTNLHTPYPIGTGSVTIDCVASGSSIEQLRTDYGTLADDTQVDISINFTDAYPILRQFEYQIFISDKVLPDGTANIYYLQDDGSWGSAGSSHTLNTARADYGSGVLIEVTTPSKPAGITGNGYLYVSIWTPLRSSGGEVVLKEVTMSPQSAGSSDVGGEFHTFQRTTKPSAQIKEIKTVATGDNLADIYLGTMYENDSTTPTETWTRSGLAEGKKLLRIMGAELMRMNASPTQVYSGDVFGYVNYLDRFTIDGRKDSSDNDLYFMVLEYSYDTKANITSLVLRQILGDELNDLKHNETPDNGNTVEPTIIG